MDLLEYLAIWGRRWRIVLATTVLGVAVAAIVSGLTQPKYVANAQLFITATGGASVVEAYQGNLFGEDRVNSYVQLAQSNQVAQRTVDQLHIDLTPQQLRSMVTASALPKSVMMTISVKNPNPSLAKDLANAVALQTSQLVTELETSARGGSPAATATIVDQAETPKRADTPKWIPNLLYGLAGGLLLGLAAAVVRDKLDRSVRSADAAAEAAGAPTLGSVPDSFGGAADALPFGASDPQSSEAFRSLRTSVLAAHDAKDSNGAIVVAAPRGDTACVTLSLAAAVAEAGRSVVVVESDLQHKNMSARLGLSDRPGLSDVLNGAMPLDAAITGSAMRGLDLLPGGSTVASPGRLLAGPEMIKVLTALCDEYEYVFVIGRPLLEYSDSLAISEWTDGVILVASMGTTTAPQLSAAAEHARLARTPVLGVVSVVPAKHKRPPAKAPHAAKPTKPAKAAQAPKNTKAPATRTGNGS